jgi:hypothetical protein
MRVENPKLVVEPGAGRTGKLAMVAYQFQYCCQNGKECNFFHEKLGAVDGIPGGKEDNQQQEVST